MRTRDLSARAAQRPKWVPAGASTEEKRSSATHGASPGGRTPNHAVLSRWARFCDPMSVPQPVFGDPDVHREISGAAVRSRGYSVKSHRPFLGRSSVTHISRSGARTHTHRVGCLHLTAEPRLRAPQRGPKEPQLKLSQTKGEFGGPRGREVSCAS